METATPLNGWMTGPQVDAWRTWLYAGFAAVGGIDEDLITAAGIDLATYHVLVVCSEHPDGARMSDLSLAMLMPASTLTARVKTMTRDGLTTVTPDPEDGRVRRVTLTPKGKDLLAAAAPHHVDHVRARVVDALTEDELVLLGELSAKILARNTR